MTGYLRLAADLQQELAAIQHIDAAGIFGSISESDTWAYSDIDLFIITPEESDRWEGVYLRRDGVRVHLQTLSLATLSKNAAINKGGPFFTALAGVSVWFDRSGELTRAVATARAFASPATRLRACREFCPGIEALHLAEKYTVKGKFRDARAALATALAKLASAALADAGVYPPRDIWASPATAQLAEYAEMQRVWTAPDADLCTLIDDTWRRVRPLLGQFSSPLVDVIKREGPLSYNELEDGKRLAGIQVSERLLDELVEHGHLIEIERTHAGLGLLETCYALPAGR